MTPTTQTVAKMFLEQTNSLFHIPQDWESFESIQLLHENIENMKIIHSASLYLQ